MEIVHASSNEFPVLMEIWEASVRATHHFLTEENIQYFKPLILANYMPVMEMYAAKDASGTITGFLGLHHNKVEMLFISPTHHRKGIGRKFINHAVELKGDIELDVNEQNEGAVKFYKECGFCVKGRSERDALGKPFPLLHLKLTTDY